MSYIASAYLDTGRRTQQLKSLMRYPIALSLCCVLFTACYYDNEEDLYGPACDSSVFGYSAKIQPILQANCYASACHGPNGENGELITYAQVKAVVDDGSFQDAVVVTRRMPDGGSLTTCELELITKWLDAGALND